MSDKFVIIGGGQAAAWVARTLRQEGYEGRIILIGEELHPPYERPPLSKDALRPGFMLANATLLPLEEMERLKVEWLAGRRAVSIDRPGRTVICEDGEGIGYDTLFLATGARPRPLPGLDMGHHAVHMLRTIDDARRLAPVMAEGGRLAIIGGGWIGLEVAASARQAGSEVVLFEREQRLCARSAPKVLSDWLLDMHCGQGVACHVGTVINAIQTGPDGVTLQLQDGTEQQADHLLIAIGIIPNDELARDCGLSIADGIVVDQSGRTSDSRIFAVGDVAAQPAFLGTGAERRESWANAQNLAIAAARTALGAEEQHVAIPWMWSDQFGHNIQLLGCPEVAASFQRLGPLTPDTESWLMYDMVGRAIGAVCINAPRNVRVARKAIAESYSL